MGSDPVKIKTEALSYFSKFISPMKLRIMKAAGFDIIEDKREGVNSLGYNGEKVYRLTARFRHHERRAAQPGYYCSSKKALDTYDIGVFRRSIPPLRLFRLYLFSSRSGQIQLAPPFRNQHFP
jgi:hypothetical protein